MHNEASKCNFSIETARVILVITKNSNKIFIYLTRKHFCATNSESINEDLMTYFTWLQ